MKNKTKSPKLKPLVSLSNLEFVLDTDRKVLNRIASNVGQRYAPYDLHKHGTTKWRHIDNPNESLKKIQKRILKNILNTHLHKLPSGMTGGVSGKSVVENAKIHIGQECIGIIDIKDCFPNTKHLKIYNVWKDFFGCGEKTIGLLTQLTTFQDRLPQGAPTSPLLCNFALTSIFNDISRYAKKNNLNLSIFVDDIAISGSKKSVEATIDPIIKILIKHKYSVRNKKVKVITSGFRQKITGVTINSKPSIGRSEIQEIRNLIIEISKMKGYIPSDKYNSIQGKITFGKQLSKSQGLKLEKFANELLVKPIIQTARENKDKTRKCKKYSRSHKFLD